MGSSTKFSSRVPFTNAVAATVIPICVNNPLFAAEISFIDAVMVLIAAMNGQTLVFGIGVEVM